MQALQSCFIYSKSFSVALLMTIADLLLESSFSSSKLEEKDSLGPFLRSIISPRWILSITLEI